jgi:hypothetical protein
MLSVLPFADQVEDKSRAEIVSTDFHLKDYDWGTVGYAHSSVLPSHPSHQHDSKKEHPE